MRKGGVIIEDAILFGKYQLCRLIGKGRAGTVFLAYHVELEEYRAIKRVPKNHVAYKQFKKEALIMKELHHPGIPIIYDIEEDLEYSYLIEEYLEGESLKSLIESQGSLTGSRIIRYGIQICDLVQYLHSAKNEPILYLDLQPKNLLLCHETVKLIDFDQAAFETEANLAKTRYGTTGFAAPEQYTGEPLDERTDLYAVGVLLYYLGTGTYPETEPEMKYFAKNRQLGRIIRTCLMPLKQDRYRSVQELKEQLENLSSQNMEWKQKTLPSLVIAFVGAAPNTGVTHVSIGLSVYLTHQKIPNLYEEKNDSGHVRNLAEKLKKNFDKSGICNIRGCALKPFYGAQVRLESHHYPVVIQDFGSDIASALNEKADIYVLVAGRMWWEAEEAKAVSYRFPAGSKWYLFHNLSNYHWKKKMDFIRGRRDMYVPYFENSWCLSEEAEGLFRVFVKEAGLTEKKGGERERANRRERKILKKKWSL